MIAIMTLWIGLCAMDVFNANHADNGQLMRCAFDAQRK